MPFLPKVPSFEARPSGHHLIGCFSGSSTLHNCKRKAEAAPAFFLPFVGFSAQFFDLTRWSAHVCFGPYSKVLMRVAPAIAHVTPPANSIAQWVTMLAPAAYHLPLVDIPRTFCTPFAYYPFTFAHVEPPFGRPWGVGPSPWFLARRPRTRRFGPGGCSHAGPALAGPNSMWRAMRLCSSVGDVAECVGMR